MKSATTNRLLLRELPALHCVGYGRPMTGARPRMLNGIRSGFATLLAMTFALPAGATQCATTTAERVLEDHEHVIVATITGSRYFAPTDAQTESATCGHFLHDFAIDLIIKGDEDGIDEVREAKFQCGYAAFFGDRTERLPGKTLLLMGDSDETVIVGPCSLITVPGNLEEACEVDDLLLALGRPPISMEARAHCNSESLSDNVTVDALTLAEPIRHWLWSKQLARQNPTPEQRRAEIVKMLDSMAAYEDYIERKIATMTARIQALESLSEGPNECPVMQAGKLLDHHDHVAIVRVTDTHLVNPEELSWDEANDETRGFLEHDFEIVEELKGQPTSLDPIRQPIPEFPWERIRMEGYDPEKRVTGNLAVLAFQDGKPQRWDNCYTQFVFKTIDDCELIDLRLEAGTLAVHPWPQNCPPDADYHGVQLINPFQSEEAWIEAETRRRRYLLRVEERKWKDRAEYYEELRPQLIAEFQALEQSR